MYLLLSPDIFITFLGNISRALMEVRALPTHFCFFFTATLKIEIADDGGGECHFFGVCLPFIIKI